MGYSPNSGELRPEIGLARLEFVAASVRLTRVRFASCHSNLVISVVARFWRGPSLNGLTVASKCFLIRVISATLRKRCPSPSKYQESLTSSQPAMSQHHHHRLVLPIGEPLLPARFSVMHGKCNNSLAAAVGQGRVSDPRLVAMDMDGCALRSISISDAPPFRSRLYNCLVPSAWPALVLFCIL